MREVAYLFERFPSFGQTFCYREVAELERQGTKVHLFSIRRPVNEPAQNWDEEIVERVHYLPEEKVLVAEVDAALKQAATRGAAIAWDRALNGRVERFYKDGELVMERRIPSDYLLTWLLSRLDRAVRVLAL